jgi:hypothetical protein
LTSGIHPAAWIPPFAVGVAGAAAAEVGLGLLLYVPSGFLGALTIILCVDMVALAAGLWSAPREVAPPWSGVRRAWFLLLITYVVGAVTAAGWEVLGGLASSRLSRGLGLAFLGAFPLYGTGLVIGASGSGESDWSVRTGVPAVIGAALGFAMVGLGRIGLRNAPFFYVAGVIVIAAGSLVQSRILAGKEDRWRECAEQGVAGGGPAVGPQVPSA